MSTRISFNYAVSPQWSPDGKHLYFNTPTGIYRKPADGSGKKERLQKGGLNDLPASVSPDGNFLLYGLFDILTLPLTGERKPEAYLQTQYAEGNAVFSPDGRRVTYNSGESGRPEIYVQRFPERRRKWLASAEGGSTPQ